MRRRATHAVVAALALSSCGGPGTAPATTPAADPATTGAIVGQVRDRATGEPLSFATVVTARPATDDPATDSATTDAVGDFAIEGLAPGTYRVSVYYSNLGARWQDIALAAGDRVELAIDLQLETTTPSLAPSAPVDNSAHRVPSATRAGRGTISGRVTDQSSGEQLEGAVIAAMAPALRDYQLAVSDAQGEFRIAGLPPGTYKLSCTYRLVDYGDIEVQRTRIQVVPGETTRVPLRLDTSSVSAPN